MPDAPGKWAQGAIFLRPIEQAGRLCFSLWQASPPPLLLRPMSDTNDLPRQIKETMIEELMLQQSVDEIGNDTVLFHPTGLGLDSVDALQLVVALEKRFGLKIADAEAAKGILRTVDSIAEAIATSRAQAPS